MTTRRHFIEKLAACATGSLVLPASAIAADKSSTSSMTSTPATTPTKKETLPIRRKVDICVLGGSCTGVFAAVRAARLGASVALVEKQNAFGGVATTALVNVWHSLYDTVFEKKIIGGLTEEVVRRLEKRDAVVTREKNESTAFTFNSAELMIELDELVLESKIIPYLHTLFSEPFYEDGKLTGVIIDGKSGRGIIKADYFIDATGDGDLCTRMGIATYTHELLQPPTMCAHFNGPVPGGINKMIQEHGEEFGIQPGFVWGASIPPTKDEMLAGTRVYGINCAEADDLTRAEMEGRRQVRAIMDMFRKYGNVRGKNHPIPFGLTGLAATIGIRETRHIKCLHQVTDEEAMNGRSYEDTIANGSYRFDVHHQEKPGVTFRYLDGTSRYIAPDRAVEKSRWRQETKENPTFYQFPLRSLIPEKTSNVLVAGRMFDAAMIAFSGMRVMVNMNQLGEAAGVTAWLALDGNKPVPQVDPKEVRTLLTQGGSILF